MKKKALITGITGQDGSYLAEFLIKKDYEVHGIIRRSSNFNTDRIDHIFQDTHLEKKSLILHYGDMIDASSINGLVNAISPDEVYNLAAQSHVGVSFDIPIYTCDTIATGTVKLLEAIRHHHPKTKFYQASSSEMFGKVVETPQRESTPFYPRSPYAAAKVYAHWITVNYRESYHLFACSGILFNHESPRRGKTFVTKKITRGLARIKLGLDDTLYLGNLDSKRDWGFAGDYVEAMWLMLQQENPEDYVIATGETHTVREFLEKSAKCFGFDLAWKGEGLKEVGVDKNSNQTIVKIDEKYIRPAEVDLLLGDPSKAKKRLNWEPRVSFDELINMMCESDLKAESKSLN